MQLPAKTLKPVTGFNVAFVLRVETTDVAPDRSNKSCSNRLSLPLSLLSHPCNRHLFDHIVRPSASAPPRLATRRCFWPPAWRVCGVRPLPAGPPHARLLETVPGVAAEQGPLPESAPRAGPRPRGAPPAPAPSPAAGADRHGDGEGEGPRGLDGLPGGGGEDKPHVPRHPHRRAALHEGALPAPHAADAEANHRAGLLNSVSHMRGCALLRDAVSHV